MYYEILLSCVIYRDKLQSVDISDRHDMFEQLTIDLTWNEEL